MWTAFVEPAMRKASSNIIVNPVRLILTIAFCTLIASSTLASDDVWNRVGFQKRVNKLDEPVLVYFWAEWCGPCSVTGPRIEQLRDEAGERAVFFKIDFDQNPELADLYGVEALPTVLILNHGAITSQLVGAKTEEEYRTALLGE